jgi:predicted hydrocarbon binding protein
MQDSQNETFEYDRDNGIITVTTPQRDCVCAMVDSKKTPPYFCQCSAGWQKETYETILDKKVDVELKESVLRGSKRCVFEIRIL